MKRYASNYTVVRYIPDPIKNEARNIGIILQCKDLGYIDYRFIKNLRTKLGNSATSTDIGILKAYIEDFSKKFKGFTSSQTKMRFKDGGNLFTESYLDNLSMDKLGKLQFSLPRGSIIADPELEIKTLFEMFVTTEGVRAEKKPKSSRLKISIRKDFKEYGLLYSKTQKKGVVGFKEDQLITLNKDIKISIDFSLKNGKFHLVEAVDMTLRDDHIWEGKTFKAAYKFDKLHQSPEKKNIETYSVVRLPSPDFAADLMKILRLESTVFDYDRDGDRNEFLSLMREIHSNDPNIFRN